MPGEDLPDAGYPTGRDASNRDDIAAAKQPILPLRIQGHSVTGVRRPGLLLIVAILTATTIRGAYAAAALPAARAKAAACCRTHCGHAHSGARADDCCQVLAHAGDPASVSAGAATDRIGTSPLCMLGVLAALLRAPVGPVADAVTAHETGPPIFLRLRTLRI